MSAADTFLPLIVADAMRPDLTPEEEEKAEKEGKVGQGQELEAGMGGEGSNVRCSAGGRPWIAYRGRFAGVYCHLGGR